MHKCLWACLALYILENGGISECYTTLKLLTSYFWHSIKHAREVIHLGFEPRENATNREILHCRDPTRRNKIILHELYALY